MYSRWRYLPLTQALAKKQDELGEGDHVFARRLGISQPFWYRIKHRQRAPGDKCVQAALSAFPDLLEIYLSIEEAYAK